MASWVALVEFGDIAGSNERDSGFSVFNGNQASINPILVTMTFSRDVMSAHGVRLIWLIRNVWPALTSVTDTDTKARF